MAIAVLTTGDARLDAGAVRLLLVVAHRLL